MTLLRNTTHLTFAKGLCHLQIADKVDAATIRDLPSNRFRETNPLAAPERCHFMHLFTFSPNIVLANLHHDAKVTLH